jgi:hypothetical protein
MMAAVEAGKIGNESAKNRIDAILSTMAYQLSLLVNKDQGLCRVCVRERVCVCVSCVCVHKVKCIDFSYNLSDIPSPFIPFNSIIL